MNKLLLIIGIIFSLLIGLEANGQICPVTMGTERITNGNFSSGNTGFGSDFTYSAASVGPGQYSVGTNPNTLNSFFATMGDHTTGSGNMLVVDVDANANKDCYNTTVNVTANTEYFFSAWFANINTNTGWSGSNGRFENSPQLKFSINNIQVGSIVKVDSVTHQWRQFFVNWNSGAVSGPVTIRIENVNTSSSNGNDLALDDISFSTGCDKIANLNSLGQNSALIDTVKNCNVNFPYTLDPALPGSYGYSWRNSAGALLSAPNTSPTYSVGTAPADGTKYYLCYEYISGCPRKDSVIFKSTPLSVELGAPKVMCAPVNITLNSGVTSPPVTVQWYKNGIPVATTANYTATDVGTYSVDLSRSGCGTASDNVTISNPASTISGSGTYCSSDNTAVFTVTGSSSVKWYLTNSSTTVLSTATTFNTTTGATNNTVPGCSYGLYVEDASSYPGTLFSAPPCTPASGSGDNTSDRLSTMIEVNQSLVLSSVDFYHATGWGATGTFTFTLSTNNPTGGPWCGGCSPAGNYNGPGTTIYTENTPSYTVGASHAIRTLTLATPQTLAPGKYWISIQGNGTPLAKFNCTPAASSSEQWVTPVADNTGNNVLYAQKALQNGNYSSAGGLFNIKFQVGSSNACQRLFICATPNCTAPVELIQFDVTKSSGGNSLIWKTSAEYNSDYYNIQRSTDGINFVTIGQIAAAGNSSSILSYNYLDVSAPSAEIVYYRLEQADFDGSLHYSEIKAVRNNQLIQELTLYPVPVKKGNNVTLNYISTLEETIVVEIYDNPGKVVSWVEYNVQEGSNSLELNTSSLAVGLYHLRILGSTSKTTKFIVE